MIRRMWRAAVLDSELYDEVESDPRLGWEALWIVLLVSVAGGIGAGWPHPGGVAAGAAAMFVGWLAWAAVTNWLGTRVFPEPQTECDFPEMLRTLGFAASPGLLAVLGVVSETRVAAFACATLWTLAATIVAVREALDYGSTGRALVVCAIGWVLQLAAVVATLALFAVGARPAL
ncbi:MAG TPA: YIP1 family protein [Candidatus Polarisedimenticolia bacterium]|nr:YIP1 family protein [Candidatus Polarisedimenticolia bacterium]